MRRPQPRELHVGKAWLMADRNERDASRAPPTADLDRGRRTLRDGSAAYSLTEKGKKIVSYYGGRGGTVVEERKEILRR